MADLEHARAARTVLQQRLRDRGTVNGVGLVRAGGDYRIAVRLAEPDDDIPARVDDVDVEVRVVGTLHLHAGG